MAKPSIKKSPSSRENASKSFRTLKTNECPSLTGKSTLTYQIGDNDKRELFIRIVGNTGGGYFNQDWIAIEDLLIQLEQCPDCITSQTISRLFNRRSANNAGFMLASLLNEGVIVLAEGKQRAYTLQDTKPFTDSMESLQADSEQGKRKPTARRKQSAPNKKSST